MDSVTDSSQLFSGDFSASLSRSDETGDAHAWIASTVDVTQFSMTGGASEYATELDTSFDIRAEVFFDAQFQLARPYNYDLRALGGGASDSEHWQSELTFMGPTQTWTERWNSVGTNSGLVEQTGVLAPGQYQFLANAYPIVFGGFDRGSAEAFLDIRLGMTPVPEPAQIAGWYGLGVFCLFRRRRWQAVRPGCRLSTS